MPVALPSAWRKNRTSAYIGAEAELGIMHVCLGPWRRERGAGEGAEDVTNNRVSFAFLMKLTRRCDDAKTCKTKQVLQGWKTSACVDSQELSVYMKRLVYTMSIAIPATGVIYACLLYTSRCA